MSEIVFGADIGDVVIDTRAPSFDPTAWPDFRTLEPMPGALEALAEINEISKGKTYFISCVQPGNEEKMEDLFRYLSIYDKTGIPPAHTTYLYGGVETKAPVAERLGLTHFADDTLSVLTAMRGIVRTRLFFPRRGEAEPDDKSIEVVSSWKQILISVRNGQS